MNEVRVVEKGIVPVYESENRRVVNARELHEFLESKQEFTNWIKGRIEKYEFVEGEDFSSFDKNIKRDSGGGTRRIDYLITIDMAKELCMVEHNQKGRQARKYFIACEKRLKDTALNNKYSSQIPGSFAEALELAASLEKERAALAERVAQDRPKVIFAETVETSKTSILVNELAKILKQNGVDVGQNRLFRILREDGFLMKCGESRNMPTQKAMELGLFEIKERTVNNPDGSIRITRTPKVTGKGQVYLVNKYRKMLEMETTA